MNFGFSAIPNLEIKIAHRNWEKALAKSFALLSIASPGEVICITGPSRGGKSKLIDELESLLTCNNFNSQDYMPVVKIEAANDSTDGKFSTKEFTYRLLDIIGHPTLTLTGDFIKDQFILNKLRNIPEWQMRIEVEKSLVQRKTRYLFIDEAQHVKYVSKKTLAPEAVMDSWKCLAKEAKLVLVIVGAYPIVNIIQKSPHLVGRKMGVDLPKYSLNKDDIRAFAVILDSFSSVLTLSKELSSLRNCTEILYHGSYGCIGLLKKWLKEALAEAMVENQGVITQDIIIKTTPPDSDRKELIKEIITGEEALRNSELFSDRITPTAHIDNSYDKQSGSKTSRKQKPFVQKPKRLKKGHRMERANDT